MRQKQQGIPLSLHQLKLARDRIDEIMSRNYPHDLSYAVFPTMEGVLILKSIMMGKGLPFPTAKQYLMDVKNGQ